MMNCLKKIKNTMNFILIFFCCSVSLSLAANRNLVQTLNTKQLIKKNVFNILNDGTRLESQRKTDSGYSYPKPSGLRLINNGLKRLKSAVQVNKPFRTYGPPRQSSRPQLIFNRPNYQNQGIKFEDKKKYPEIYSNQVIQKLVLSHSIANQNEEPFKHSANYLPPQNQRLPGYINQNQFSPGSFNQQNQVYNIQNSPISDAAQFLTQNSDAIAKFYEDHLKDSQEQQQNDEFEPLKNLKTITNTQEFNRPSIFKQDQLINFSQTPMLNKQDMEFSKSTQNHANFLVNQDLSSFPTQTSLHQPINFDNLVQNHLFKSYGSSDIGFLNNQTFPVPTLTSWTASTFGTPVKPIISTSYGQPSLISNPNLLPGYRTTFLTANSDAHGISTPAIFNHKPFNIPDVPKFNFPSVVTSLSSHPTSFNFPINTVQPIFPIRTDSYGIPAPAPVVKPAVKPTYLYLLNSAK